MQFQVSLITISLPLILNNVKRQVVSTALALPLAHKPFTIDFTSLAFLLYSCEEYLAAIEFKFLFIYYYTRQSQQDWITFISFHRKHYALRLTPPAIFW